ncbi:MAG: T9SS type A sorting domain-containing protein [Bacteroidetes bacterium]|nr:T9SS type A sorting domain-containing protein [Bacteroidota bacterium]
MRKHIFFFGFTLIHFLLVAQKAEENNTATYYHNSGCKSSFAKVKFERENTSANIHKYLISGLENLRDQRATLKLNYRNESPGGFHYSFTQLFNGVEVYQSEIKVNIDKQNTIHSLFDNSENTSQWNFSTANANENSVIAIHPVTKQVLVAERKIENHSTEILSVNGETIFSRDMNMYAAPPDSMVSGKVFNPDPLTTAGQVYGGSYVDNGDANASWLDAQEQTVNFTANFNGSQFSLQSAYVRVVDFDLPTLAPVTSSIPQFYFDRSQTGFEDVNAFYHISTMQNHIHALGFNAADGLVEIDPHALSGADNSFYSGSNPKRIYYGTGGVDDAEDADVCVHEYGHFVSDGAAPGSNSGFERNALDEAFGDYLAGSYSRSLNSFNDFWVFNWDGHNEFWNGRILNSTKVYPQDLDGSSYYKNSSIWSAVLWCLNGSIGRDATDSLILQTHYAYAQNILMDEAAQLLIDADTLLTGGKYYCPIYNCLFQHGLNPANPFSPCDVGINELSEFPIKFFNHTNSFSIINANLYEMKIEVLNVNGQVVAVLNDTKAMLNYENDNLASGIYLVNVNINAGAKDKLNKTFKWSKVN